YSLEDVDAKELSYWVPRFMEKLSAIPVVRDVASDQLNQGLLASLVIDRDTASRLGVLPSAIDNTLYDAFGQRQVSTIYTQLNQYRVVLEVDPRFQQNPESLKDIYVASNSALQAYSGSTANITNNAQTSVSTTPNAQVPLSAFTRFEPGATALALNHQGQFPAVTVSFNLAPGAALGDAVKAINEAKSELNMPASIQATFEGTAAAFLNSLANEPVLILAALITVYIVLGVLYESYIHPITILSTLPSAGVGAILAEGRDRKSTRLNSSHSQISYAVFCLKKKKKTTNSGRFVARQRAHDAPAPAQCDRRRFLDSPALYPPGTLERRNHPHDR